MSLPTYEDCRAMIREKHQVEVWLMECEECFQRYEVNGEERPADGYICDLGSAAGCSCNPDEEIVPDGGYHWVECPKAVELEKILDDAGVESFLKAFKKEG